MKVKIEDLTTAVERALKAVGRSVNGITLLKTKDRLEIHRTNGSSYAVSKIENVAGENFRIVIDGMRLLSLFKDTNPDQDCELKLEATCMRVKFGKVKAKLPLLTESHPLLSDTQWGQFRKALTFGSDSRQMLRQVLPTCADDKDPRYYLRGVMFDRSTTGELILVGTNGHWMTKIDTGLQTDNWPTKDVLVPVQMLTTLVDCIGSTGELSVEFATGEGGVDGIYFKTPQFTFLSPLIEGTYPKWLKVIPALDESSYFDAPLGAFLSAVKRMQRIQAVDTKSLGLDLVADDMSLTVMAPTIFDTDNTDVSMETVDLATAAVQATDILVNAEYLLKALQAFDGETVKVSIVGKKMSLIDNKVHTVIMGMNR